MEISMFGPLAVRVNGQPILQNCTRRARRLFALLALRNGREIERPWLAGTLWPESTEQQALYNLRETLLELRQSLGSEAGRIQSFQHRALRLDLIDASVDTLAFDAALKREDTASLEEAVSLYSRPLLEDWTEEWLLPERQAREQALLRALEILAGQATTQSDWPTAVQHLRRLLAGDPLRESAVQMLLQALARQGDGAAALLAYQEFRRLLYRELRVEPAQETTDIFRQLRAEMRRSAQAYVSRSVSPSADIPKESAYSRPVSGRFPRPFTSLIGREEEARQVQQRLDSCRLVTLTGTGGVGKSRLAMQAAEDRAAEGEEVWFVELAAISDPSHVTAAVAATLNLQELAGISLTQALLDFLREKRLLLILDNCEHLIEDCAHLAETLLAGCAQVKILATSRQPLGITGEQVYRVPSLALPEATPAAEALPVSFVEGYAAIRLLVERAQAVRPDFQITPENAAAATQVCRQLDGIPLALELAAARMKALSAQQIAARLDDRFHLLTAGSRTALPRHQTLRAMIDWSYDLLDEAERRLLLRLSVFAGGWTLEAAEAVCAGDDRDAGEILDRLSSMVDKSLVIYEEREGQTRYRQLETIRQYARDRLPAGEYETLRRRHRDYFLCLAEEAETHFFLPAEPAWFSRLDAEHDNLRAALDWCRNDPEGAESGLRMTGALGHYWQMRCRLSEEAEYAAAMLTREGAEKRTAARAKALHRAGLCDQSRGDELEYARKAEESLAIYRELDDKQGIAVGLLTMGNCADSLPARRAFLEEAIVMMRADKRVRRHLGYALNFLAWTMHGLGDKAAHRALSEECLTLRPELGDGHAISQALCNMAHLEYEEGHYAAAKAYQTDVLRIHLSLGLKLGCTVSIWQLARIALAQGRLEAGVQIMGAVQTFYETMEDSNLPGYESWAQASLLEYDRTISAARSALGEEAFSAALAQGRARTLEQAVEYAPADASE